MKFILYLSFCFLSNLFLGQKIKKDSLLFSEVQNDSLISLPKNKNIIIEKMVFNPTKAGLYSAILPGLGQYYNKKYWKIPVIYGALGTGFGFIIYNDKRYKRYRNAFIAELNGVPHEFSDENYSKEVLGRQQDLVKRQRDFSIAITSLIYFLNIVDAVVDAHLYQGRKDPDLAIQPTVIQDLHENDKKMGLRLCYRF